MLAYRLRHRVAIQEPQQVQDTVTGEITTTWVDVILDDGTVLDAVPAARVARGWCPRLVPPRRGRSDGRVYTIARIDPGAGGRRERRLRCSEGLTDGRWCLSSSRA